MAFFASDSIGYIMRISIVIPCFNEAANIAPLLARISPVIAGLQHEFEIICVDDCSRDSTLEVLIDVQKTTPEVRIIKLSRNFGKEAALSAGLDHAIGDAVILMDADLQHPPETIPKFLDALKEGIDVVYGVRETRKTDGPVRGLFSRTFYRIFSSLGEVPIPAEAGDFRLMTRRAADALRALPERRRFYKGLYAWIGFGQIGVPYEVEKRHDGVSNWSLWKLFGYAWGGLISFTVAPLRLMSVTGFLVAFLAGLYAIWIVIETLVSGRNVEGYATLATAMFFFGGIQLFGLGVLGEYIARIFDEVKGRPAYIVESIHG